MYDFPGAVRESILPEAQEPTEGRFIPVRPDSGH